MPSPNVAQLRCSCQTARPASGAAGLVAVEKVCDLYGEVLGGCAFGFGVHGAGAVVVGQDLAEVVRGAVGVAATQGVDVGAHLRWNVLVVGFAGDVSVDEGFVGGSAAGHGDIRHGARGVLAEDWRVPAE
jgi:hypothetical protein